MIQNNQLKEGNWVRLIAKTDSGSVDAPARVSEILDTEVKTTISDVGQINPFSNLHGIPLTPDLMRRNGFSDSLDKEGFLIKDSVLVSEFYDEAQERFSYGIMVGFDDGSMKHFSLEYVHDLQNFFPQVLGKEIEVEL